MEVGREGRSTRSEIDELDPSFLFARCLPQTTSIKKRAFRPEQDDPCFSFDPWSDTQQIFIIPPSTSIDSPNEVPELRHRLLLPSSISSSPCFPSTSQSKLYIPLLLQHPFNLFTSPNLLPTSSAPSKPTDLLPPLPLPNPRPPLPSLPRRSCQRVPVQSSLFRSFGELAEGQRRLGVKNGKEGRRQGVGVDQVGCHLSSWLGGERKDGAWGGEGEGGRTGGVEGGFDGDGEVFLSWFGRSFLFRRLGKFLSRRVTF